MNKVFIQAATQISMQQPLCEQWMTEPVLHSEPLVKAVNPVFRDFIPANEARRMGGIMKRAIVTALKVLADTGVEHPDAIITGTSIGSLDYTEKILNDMTENGEQALSPTFFMQSTHNTVGSSIAIYTKSHGYNTTYSHGQLSFDLALQDAWMQMQLGHIGTALVGGHDEMVESYFELLRKAGYVGQEGMVPCSEVAMSMLFTTDKSADNLCELAAIRIFRQSSMADATRILDEMLKEGDMNRQAISAVMMGTNGHAESDRFYSELGNALFPDKSVLHYKHLFGENFTASAFGVYAAAHCLKAGVIPACLMTAPKPSKGDVATQRKSILVVNQMNGTDYSFILLRG